MNSLLYALIEALRSTAGCASLLVLLSFLRWGMA